MPERLILEVRYTDGEQEVVLPAIHPDVALEYQGEHLRQYLIRQLAAGRPLAIEVDRSGVPGKRRDARLIIPASSVRNVEVSIVEVARRSSADEYSPEGPAHLRPTIDGP